MSVKKSKQTKIIGISVIAATVVVLVCALAYMKVYNSKKPTNIAYFYENVCGSCDYEGDFIKLFNDELGDIKSLANYSLTMHNTFSKGDDIFYKMCKKLKIPAEERTLPMLIIKDQYLRSEAVIESEMREVFCSSFEIKEENVLKYYFRPTCKDCEIIKGFLDETFKKHSDVPVRRIDTTDPAPKEKFKALLTDLKIPSEEWEIPFIYYKGKFLSGDKEIEEKLEEFLNANK